MQVTKTRKRARQTSCACICHSAGCLPGQTQACCEAISESCMYIKLASSELLLYALAWQHVLIRDMLGGILRGIQNKAQPWVQCIGNDTMGICLHEGKACTAAHGALQQAQAASSM